MAFSRANSIGWAYLEVLTSAQMNALDIDHANAIDGAAGGTYSPSSAIVFDGDVQWAATRLPKVTSRVYTRLQGLHFLHGSNKASIAGGGTLAPNPWNCGDWNFTAGGISIDSFYADTTGSSDDPAELWLECPNLIDKSVIDSYGIYCKAYTGAALPEFMPSIHLYRLNCATGAAAGIAPGEREDQSVDNAAFRTYHTIETATGIGEAIDQTAHPIYRYYMRVHGESGSNAQANFAVLNVYINFTVTEIAPG